MLDALVLVTALRLPTASGVLGQMIGLRRFVTAVVSDAWYLD